MDNGVRWPEGGQDNSGKDSLLSSLLPGFWGVGWSVNSPAFLTSP